MRILLGILYLVTANFAKECLVQLEDTRTYKCVWNFDKKRFKTIDSELHVAPTKTQIKLIERSPQILKCNDSQANDAQVKLKWIVRSRQILRGKEVKQASLSAKFAFYPLDGKSYIPFENEQPDVQITVREPSSFIVFNQQFYPHDTHLHIDCVSISIPPADVTFERKNRESGDFEEIDRELLMSVEGTFERGFIWNTTLDDDTELRCTSTRNGNKYTAIKSIIVADEAFTVFSAIEKSDKATSLELPNVIYEGDNVKLTCVVPNGAADWNVSWRFKNNDLESSDTEVKGHSKLVVLDLKDITPSSSGKYQCVVKKGESEEFQEIVLKVESISKPYHTDAESRSTVTVNYDETFVIDCGMTGNPLPDVKWFKDGHPYTSGDMEGSILKVSRARAEDDGQFQCLAVNRAGLTSNFIEVQVDNVPERSSFFYWFLTILVLAAIILICYLFYKLRANKKITKQKDIQLNMLYLMKQNDPGPLPENLKLLPIEERADYLRYPEEFEIARENLEICEKIGSGMFGFVNKGYLSMADPKSQIEYKTRLPVAIKSTKKSFDMELQTMLFEELKIMCAIEKHPNVISLIGAVTTNMRKGEFYLVTEYADNGDLLNYLRKHRETFHNTLIDMEEPVVNENYSVPSQQIEYTRLLPSSDILSTADLLSFALQIANGMEFLAAVPCVHRDLAARNANDAQVKLKWIVRSRQILRGKEVKQASLSAKFAFYPLDGKSYIPFENEQPDVQITVREPSSFIVFNQQFYPPDTHLHIDCVSISIPPADVTFERKNRESGDFEEIDRELLMSVEGTFERGFIWNTTLDDDTELRCTSTRNGNKYTAIKSIIVADEAFTVFSAIEKSDKATSLDFQIDITPSSSGKYQCVVKKGESEEFQEIVLKVESISKPYHTDAESRSTVTVNYDETFVIDCGMTGNPLPDVKWFKDGHPYTSGDMEGSILKVSRARAEDDGQFQCLAVNRAGLTSNFIEVQVDNVPERSSFFYWFLTILVLAAIILICYLFYKLRANKKITKQKDIQLNMLYLMKQNDPGPLPENLKLLPIEERADYLRYPEEFEIARENLEICEKIGSGMFGFVNKGYLSMADPKSQIEYKTRLPVAIKSTKKSFDMELQTMLFEELKIMCAIEKHPNVISLIGAVTTNMRKGEFYLVTEYADNGDLLNYLRKHRETFHNTLIDMEEPVVNENYSVPSQQIEYTRLLPSSDILSTADLLSFALQIANGMEFLAAVPVRILIILTSSNSSISVCPSRFSCTKCIDHILKNLQNCRFWTCQTIKNGKQVTLPVRWMAPESVQTYKFTEKTDVWSYGITLYEIFTLGNRPYAQVPNEQLEEFLRSGMRNEQPEYCHDDLYALMKNCWHKSPDVRPNFNTCVHYLKAHLKECAGELLNRVDGQLHLELEEQYKLEEWLMKNRPDIQGGTFTRKPKNNEEEEAPTERYLIVESST
ncbi:Protein CBG17535 [Caenorhabditis briggsae]|uniref:receptor protein-tyrosine kinase n=1 Tax=Caenorhabditis briggsae TaxID=6238 RepID=A8XR68_CAEBR|nr:Protein CBG17535 [Caenorhabditis briggsae]CAP35165.2 Protein CBG17535 [Caenorhabditis briggsae]